jgi:uncharacterized protein (TIGR00251 family)
MTIPDSIHMDNIAVFDITVSPKSSRSEITIDASGKVKIYLNSPPVDGKANAECISILSKKLKTAKSNIAIEKGDHGRNKRISVSGMTLEEVMAKIKGEN